MKGPLMPQEETTAQPAPGADADELKRENEILKTALGILGDKLRLAETQAALNQAQLHALEQQA